LATQIGSQLTGITYILDEPSIGLHQRDNQRLIKALKNLRDGGNSVLVVEHDKDIMLASDHLIDIGPAAGLHGGRNSKCGNTGTDTAGKYNYLPLPEPYTANRSADRKEKGNGKQIVLTEPPGIILRIVFYKIAIGYVHLHKRCLGQRQEHTDQ